MWEFKTISILIVLIVIAIILLLFSGSATKSPQRDGSILFISSTYFGSSKARFESSIIKLIACTEVSIMLSSFVSSWLIKNSRISGQILMPPLKRISEITLQDVCLIIFSWLENAFKTITLQYSIISGEMNANFMSIWDLRANPASCLSWVLDSSVIIKLSNKLKEIFYKQMEDRKYILCNSPKM